MAIILTHQTSLVVLVAGIILHGGIDEVATGLYRTIAEWVGFPRESFWPRWLSLVFFVSVTAGAILGTSWPLLWSIFKNPTEGVSALLGALLADMLKTHLLPTISQWFATTRNSNERILAFYKRIRVPGTTTALLVQPLMIATVLRIMYMDELHLNLIFFALGTALFLGLRPLFRTFRWVVVDRLKLVPKSI